MQWIDEQLEKRQMTRRELVNAVPGMTETKLSLVMSGNRKLSAVEADAIRRHFGYRLPDDPPGSLRDRIDDQIAMLGEGQIQSVVLYLEALSGTSPERKQAS